MSRATNTILSILLLSAIVAAKPLSDFFENPDQQKPAKTQKRTSDNPIAVINGHSIPESEFIRTLIDVAGVKVLRQMILLEGARQLARDKNITVTKEDIDREMQMVLDDISQNTSAEMSQQAKRTLLQTVLAQRGMTFSEFQLGIRRQAYLRAVADVDININDKMLQREYQRQYGPRRRVRAIVVNRHQPARKIYSQLQDGTDFAKLAREHSVHLPSIENNGLIGTISKIEPDLPQNIVSQAFNTPEGKTSAIIKADGRYWIIRVEKKFAPRPIKFDRVKDKLKEQVRKRLVRRMMEKLQNQIIKQSRIKIYDKDLAENFDNWAQNQQQQ